MLALIATITSVSTSYTVVFFTMGAYNVITPTYLGKRLLADVFVVEVVNHCDNRVEFAKIYHTCVLLNCNTKVRKIPEENEYFVLSKAKELLKFTKA